MAVVEELVARIPGAVLALDEGLTVLASSQGSEEGRRLLPADVLGRPCYEAVSLIDAGTGDPCREHCPLVRGSTQVGWAFNRMLTVNRSGSAGEQLDCLLLRCITAGEKQRSLCFLKPSQASKVETRARILEAIEAVYPAVSGRADLKEVLAIFLEAALKGTSAEGGEVFLLNAETHAPDLMECRGLAPEAMQEFRRSAVGDDFPGTIVRSQLPLLGVGTWSGGAQGLYLCVPLVADGAVVGTLAVATPRPDFDVAMAVRVIFPLAAQLGTYLRAARFDHRRPNDADGATPSAQDARLRVHAMGPFRLILDGQPVPLERFQRLKALTLLRFLVAHRGHPVSREALMEVLWPGSEPSRAGANLRVVVHALRRGLEPDLGKGMKSSFVVSDDGLVYLEPSARVWVDAEEFDRKARLGSKLSSDGRNEEALAVYRDAASLYQGDYLENEPYSDWCLFERERLREVYLGVMRQMASILAARGDLERAIEACQSALALDRGREEVHREMMRLLWRAGRRREALRQYEACRQTLRQELGVGPARETVALHETMLKESCP